MEDIDLLQITVSELRYLSLKHTIEEVLKNPGSGSKTSGNLGVVEVVDGIVVIY